MMDSALLIDILSMICVGGTIVGYESHSSSNASNTVGVTDLAKIIPEMWATAMWQYFETALVFKPFFDDYSALVTGKGNKIHIPEFPATASATKGEQSSVVYSASTTDATELDIDEHEYVAHLFEDMGVVQANEELFTKYAKGMAYQLAKGIDTNIETELQSINTSMSLSANNTLTGAKAEEAFATILELDIDPMECAWFVNPTLYADIASNASFISNQNAGGVLVSGVDATGAVGSLYGMPVLMSNLISSASGTGVEAGYIAHKSAVAVAIQKGIRVQSEYSVDYLGTKMVADVLYGVQLTDDASFKKGIKFNQAS